MEVEAAAAGLAIGPRLAAAALRVILVTVAKVILAIMALQHRPTQLPTLVQAVVVVRGESLLRATPRRVVHRAVMVTMVAVTMLAAGVVLASMVLILHRLAHREVQVVKQAPAVYTAAVLRVLRTPPLRHMGQEEECA